MAQYVFPRVVYNTVDPGISDDSDQGYFIGQCWVNIVDKIAFQCVDNTPGAAIWEKTTAGNAFEKTTDPTSSDDFSHGYRIGDVWLNILTSPRKVFVCVKDATGSAIWEKVSSGSAYSKTTDPTVNDDYIHGYRIGDNWINTSDEKVYFCIDHTNGSAIWKEAGRDSYGLIDGGCFIDCISSLIDGGNF